MFRHGSNELNLLSHDIASGLAAVPPRFLERPHVLGAWTAQPLEASEPPTPENAMDIDGAEQPMDERQVAAKDPLCGLLQMQVEEITTIPAVCEMTYCFGCCPL